jgi:hypothetical protein
MLRSIAFAPRLPLALTALALTAACSDAPLAPDASAPSARPSLAASSTPKPSSVVAAPAGMITGWMPIVESGAPNITVPGVTVRYLTDNTTTEITDNGFGDLTLYPGVIMNYMPISTSYKAEILSVPIGYHMPTANVVTGKIAGPQDAPYIDFKGVSLSPKKQVRVNFLNMQKQPILGGTVVVTAPGLDFSWTITDGGAGDLTPLGAQAPADGTVTLYSPVFSISEWKVCETAAPAGYLLTEPSCVSAKVQATKMTHTFTLLHQGGIIAPPPAS